MRNFKSFMFGVAASFAIYYITRKNSDGKSIFDEILEHPADVANQAKNYAIEEAVGVLKEQMS
jgi:hypothetical protein